MITPKMSDQACAIIPGRKLFLHTASIPNWTPNPVILKTGPTPSYRWPIPKMTAWIRTANAVLPVRAYRAEAWSLLQYSANEERLTGCDRR